MPEQAAVIDVKIDGAEAVRQRLLKLPRRLRFNVMRRVLRQAANEVRDDIREVVSTGPHAKGRTRKNVMVRARRGTRNSIAASVWIRKVGKGDNPRNAWYWFMVERGTIFQPAQGKIRRAFDVAAPRVIRTVAVRAHREIDKEIAKLNK